MAKKAAAKSEVPTIERKIVFFRTACGDDDAGKPLSFDPAPVLKHVHALPFDEGRYLTLSGGQFATVWVDRSTMPCRLRIANVRRSGLPAVEQAGKLSPLKIPADSGIAEQTHVVFFPDNFVGAEFNFYGPRMSRVAAYLMAKAEAFCPDIHFDVLLRQDVAERLKRLEDIRLFDLKVRSSFIDTIEEADQDLGSCFKAAAKAGNAEEVQVILRPAAHSKKLLKAGLLASVKRILKADNLQLEASRFVVRGQDRDTDAVEQLDLLSDDLIVKKNVVLQNTRFRSVDSESAYSAIEASYAEMKGDLLKAAGASV